MIKEKERAKFIIVLIINRNQGTLPDWNFSNNSKDNSSHFKLLAPAFYIIKVVLLHGIFPGRASLLCFTHPKNVSKYKNILLKLYHKLSHCSENSVFIHGSIRIFGILPRTKLTKGRQKG